MAQHSRQEFYEGHFNSDKPNSAVNWFVAISNCDAMRGIDIHFRFRVYGHSMPCSQDQANDVFFNNLRPLIDAESSPAVVPSITSGGKPTPPPPASSPPPSDQSYHGKWPICTIEGYVNTTNSWYGFLKNISLQDGGGFKYHFSLPFSMNVSACACSIDLRRFFKFAKLPIRWLDYTFFVFRNIFSSIFFYLFAFSVDKNFIKVSSFMVSLIKKSIKADRKKRKKSYFHIEKIKQVLFS